jgi:2-methylisocitrate lyase-like PEP mutase family enzyme
LPAKQLKALGFSLAIWPGAVMAVAAAATQNALKYLAEHGTTAGSPVPTIDAKALHELVGFQDVWDFEKKYVDQS